MQLQLIDVDKHSGGEGGREQEVNQKRSKYRMQIEHIFAQQARRWVRTIGKERASMKVSIMSLVGNARRWSFLAE